MDFRKRQQRPYTPLMIRGTPVERLSCRAVQLIACNSHANLVSKVGSLIGGKSQITCFQMEQQLIHRAVLHWQARQYSVQYRRSIAFGYEHDIAYFFHTYIYVYFLFFVFVFHNCTVHGADLTYISLLVIYSLYNCVCDKYKSWNLEYWKGFTKQNISSSLKYARLCTQYLVGLL